VAARVGQSAVVVLAVNLDQVPRQFAQQRGANRLVVDESLGTAVGAQPAPDDQRLAEVVLDPRIVERGANRFGQPVELEGRGDAGLVRTAAHQPGLGAFAQRQPERVEQDRLARPGLAGEHAKPTLEGEVERLDQDDVADGKRGQHGPPVS